MRRDGAVVDQAEPVVAFAGQRGVRLVYVHEPAEQVRDLAVEVPGCVRLEPALVALEQQGRRARLLHLGVDGLAIAGLELSGEEGLLAVDHHARSHLEDVRGLAEQASVLHHLRPPPPRLDHHLHAGAVACLEGPGRQEREVALAVPEERGAETEQGAVEVRIDAAQRHYQEKSCTISASPW